MATIIGADTFDVRFPTAAMLDGLDVADRLASSYSNSVKWATDG